MQSRPEKTGAEQPGSHSQGKADGAYFSEPGRHPLVREESFEMSYRIGSWPSSQQFNLYINQYLVNAAFWTALRMYSCSWGVIFFHHFIQRVDDLCVF